MELRLGHRILGRARVMRLPFKCLLARSDIHLIQVYGGFMTRQRLNNWWRGIITLFYIGVLVGKVLLDIPAGEVVCDEIKKWYGCVETGD